jgi:hypothetical protein
MVWLFFRIQVVHDRDVCSQFYTGIRVWVALSLALRYRFL